MSTSQPAGTSPRPGRSPDELFASSSVPVHVVRGVLGAVLAVAAFVLAGRSNGLSLLLLVPAGLLWRGCPTCWALGLVQTRARCRITGR